MSTRLERANRQAAQRKLHPSKHREIVIAERNKEIKALKARKRKADKHLKWAAMALELVYNGLKYGPCKLVETDDPATCATELWNVKTARHSIKLALAGGESKPQEEK